MTRLGMGLHRRRGRSVALLGGAVAVEFALAAPALFTFLFGTLEFGTVFKDLLMLNQGAREASRIAALGSPTGDISAAASSRVPTLSASRLTTVTEYRTYDGTAWSAWTTLTNSGTPSKNVAPTGSQIRIRLTYGHSLVSGAFFTRLADGGTGSIVTLHSSMVTRRE